MTQTLFPWAEAITMTRVMCERVELSSRAGSYILSMCRMRSSLPGQLVDMVEVAQLIKYVSENQEDLKVQFRNPEWVPDNDIPKTDKPGRFTFLK